MTEQQFLVTKSELETIVYEELQKERRILFDLCREEYFVWPDVREKKYRGKTALVILKTEWEEHVKQIFGLLNGLAFARDAIQTMEPVYKEYRQAYENEHHFCLDGQIKKTVTSYDAEEFERVRDKFEEERFGDFECEVER